MVEAMGDPARRARTGAILRWRRRARSIRFCVLAAARRFRSACSVRAAAPQSSSIEAVHLFELCDECFVARARQLAVGGPAAAGMASPGRKTCFAWPLLGSGAMTPHIGVLAPSILAALAHPTTQCSPDPRRRQSGSSGAIRRQRRLNHVYWGSGARQQARRKPGSCRSGGRRRRRQRGAVQCRRRLPPLLRQHRAGRQASCCLTRYLCDVEIFHTRHFGKPSLSSAGVILVAAGRLAGLSLRLVSAADH